MVTVPGRYRNIMLKYTQVIKAIKPGLTLSGIGWKHHMTLGMMQEHAQRN